MFTVNEAAQRLEITPERVRNMIYAHTLAAERFGRVWMIPEAAVAKRILSNPKAGRPRKSPQEAKPESGQGHSSSDSTTGVSRMLPDINSTRELYQRCKAELTGCYDPEFLLQAKTLEEQRFYTTVADFFLQQRQAEFIKDGVF